MLTAFEIDCSRAVLLRVMLQNFPRDQGSKLKPLQTRCYEGKSLWDSIICDMKCNRNKVFLYLLHYLQISPILGNTYMAKEVDDLCEYHN